MTPEKPAVNEIFSGFDDCFKSRRSCPVVIMKDLGQPGAELMVKIKNGRVKLGGKDYAIMNMPTNEVKSAYGFALSGPRVTAAYFMNKEQSGSVKAFDKKPLYCVTTGTNVLDVKSPGKPMFRTIEIGTGVASLIHLFKEKTFNVEMLEKIEDLAGLNDLSVSSVVKEIMDGFGLSGLYSTNNSFLQSTTSTRSKASCIYMKNASSHDLN